MTISTGANGVTPTVRDVIPHEPPTKSLNLLPHLQEFCLSKAHIEVLGLRSSWFWHIPNRHVRNLTKDRIQRWVAHTSYFVEISQTHLSIWARDLLQYSRVPVNIFPIGWPFKEDQVVKSRHILRCIHANHRCEALYLKPQGLQLPFIHLKSQTRTLLNFSTKSSTQNDSNKSLKFHLSTSQISLDKALSKNCTPSWSQKLRFKKKSNFWSWEASWYPLMGGSP